MRNPWSLLKGRRVLVNLKSGTALRGVVWQTVRGHVELRDCEVIQHQQVSPATDNQRFAEAELDFYQVLA